MIGKILLTLAVIGFAWFAIRLRQQRARDDIGVRPAAVKPSNPLIKWLSYGVLGLMLSASLIFFGWQIEQGYRLVTVRVVDAQTGRSVSYIARRMDVDDRHFVTLDGLEVMVADGERIELLSIQGNHQP